MVYITSNITDWWCNYYEALQLRLNVLLLVKSLWRHGVLLIVIKYRDVLVKVIYDVLVKLSKYHNFY